MAYQDEQLTCKDCGTEFAFTVSEQEFYAEKGFENKPARCPQCRAARKASNGNSRPQREMFTAICSECGTETKVPFRPTEGKPVYCRDCFQGRR
jgi:CxxC-x17-CxxC domain-containing protein